VVAPVRRNARAFKVVDPLQTCVAAATIRRFVIARAVLALCRQRSAALPVCSVVAVAARGPQMEEQEAGVASECSIGGRVLQLTG
jgi:hypothetical protein